MFQINICVLQASIVEEVISFSALDNIRDLTCVSLLAICLEELTTKFHFSKQVRTWQVNLLKYNFYGFIYKLGNCLLIMNVWGGGGGL